MLVQLWITGMGDDQISNLTVFSFSFRPLKLCPTTLRPWTNCWQSPWRTTSQPVACTSLGSASWKKRIWWQVSQPSNSPKQWWAPCSLQGFSMHSCVLSAGPCPSLGQESLCCTARVWDYESECSCVLLHQGDVFWGVRCCVHVIEWPSTNLDSIAYVHLAFIMYIYMV